MRLLRSRTKSLSLSPPDWEEEEEEVEIWVDKVIACSALVSSLRFSSHSKFYVGRVGSWGKWASYYCYL